MRKTFILFSILSYFSNHSTSYNW